MPHVIADSCVQDDSCLSSCPVDCIHPRTGDRDFGEVEQLYIEPSSCIDCGSCISACPVGAIYADFDLPPSQAHALELNAAFFTHRTGR